MRSDHPSLGIIRVFFQSLVEPFHSSGCIVLQHVDLRSDGVCARVLAPLGDDSIELFLTAFIILEFEKAEHAVEPEVLRRGVESNGVVIVSNGLIVLLLSDATQPSQFIHTVDIGIDIHGSGDILFSPVEIIEEILCQGSVVPRFIEIRFGIDSPVEMLNGEHIVFIIQCAAPIHNQSVDIVL